MHYTRVQLDKLKSLSVMLTGRSSYWRKLQKQAVRVLDVKYGTREYVTYHNNPKGPGTRMRLETALSKGHSGKGAFKEEHSVTERLEYDNIVAVMETALEYREVVNIPQGDRSMVVAYLVFHGRFRNLHRLALTLSEVSSPEEMATQKTELNETKDKLANENLRTLIAEMLDKPSDQESLLLDAGQFLKDLLYVQEFPEEATKHVQLATDKLMVTK